MDFDKNSWIPKVTRGAGGIRDYQKSDLGGVELSKCMRGAGLSEESIIEYVKLCQEGDGTIPQRYKLLVSQREALMEQRRQNDSAMERLDYKIGRYEIAVKTGKLSWKIE